MNHASLFSGIGGFDLAAEWMGWKNVLHCEIEAFPRKILQYYWPNAISYGDITKTDFTIHRGQIDLISGGFPCQPYSVAGKRKGKEDERHLWPEMLRAIREIQPRYIVGENVSGLLNWNGGLVFNEVQTDLETAGYEVQPFVLPACAIGGWHRRDRVWFIANSVNGSNNRVPRKHEKKGKKERIQKRDKVQRPSEPNNIRANSNNRSKRTKRSFKETIPKLKGLQRGEDGRIYADIEGRSNLSTPVLCRSYDGIPSGVDRVTAYGNAVVPQVVLQIFKAIQAVEDGN